MTLIVGIKCQDGVVVGSDGAATFSTPLGQAQTIKQATSKLHVIGSRIVLGVSGPVGLGQSYLLEIDALKTRKGDPKNLWPNVAEAREFLRQSMWKHAGPAYENAGTVSRSIGQAAGYQVMSTSLIAFPIDHEARLIQFDHQCLPEEATTNLPFVSIGSGQPVADPFLAFIRRTIWPPGLPSISDGIFAAVWTIQHAIESLPGGVAEPIEIVTLRQKDGQAWRADRFTDSDLAEHREMINTLQKQMRGFCESMFTVQPTTPIPQQA